MIWRRWRIANRPQDAILPHFFRECLNLLRELADENAYHRHLVRQGIPHSGAEWRRFSEERLNAKYARAKCC